MLFDTEGNVTLLGRDRDTGADVEINLTHDDVRQLVLSVFPGLENFNFKQD